MSDKFSHINEMGRALMVDVTGKETTCRQAVAMGAVDLGETAFRMLQEKTVPKGDVLATARIAGIMAAKKVDSLIPLCHPLPVENVQIDFDADPEKYSVNIRATVRVTGKTGVEMEALTAVSMAALTIYDMCKAITKGIKIKEIYLLQKKGGKSGEWNAGDAFHGS
jgi:cyclic pyranopterin phosphate synthase